MISRSLKLVCLLCISWGVMTTTHEVGHILGGWSCGGHLASADLLPWHLPYSIFDHDPVPLITLWSGPLFGAVAPLTIALVVRNQWFWFVANFCVLANGLYLAVAWIVGDVHLDTTRLLDSGASPISIILYCGLTIVYGYIAFRRSIIQFLFEGSDVIADDSSE